MNDRNRIALDLRPVKVRFSFDEKSLREELQKLRKFISDASIIAPQELTEGGFLRSLAPPPIKRRMDRADRIADFADAILDIFQQARDKPKLEKILAVGEISKLLRINPRTLSLLAEGTGLTIKDLTPFLLKLREDFLEAREIQIETFNSLKSDPRLKSDPKLIEKALNNSPLLRLLKQVGIDFTRIDKDGNLLDPNTRALVEIFENSDQGTGALAIQVLQKLSGPRDTPGLLRLRKLVLGPSAQGNLESVLDAGFTEFLNAANNKSLITEETIQKAAELLARVSNRGGGGIIAAERRELEATSDTFRSSELHQIQSDLDQAFHDFLEARRELEAIAASEAKGERDNPDKEKAQKKLADALERLVQIGAQTGFVDFFELRNAIQSRFFRSSLEGGRNSEIAKSLEAAFLPGLGLRAKNPIEDLFKSILQTNEPQSKSLFGIFGQSGASELEKLLAEQTSALFDALAEQKELRHVANLDELEIMAKHLNDLEGLRDEHNKKTCEQVEEQADETGEKMEGTFESLKASLEEVAKTGAEKLTAGLTEALFTAKSLGEALKGLGQELAKMLFQKVVGGAIGQVFEGIIRAIFPPRAAGGSVNLAQPYLVGERGPELFVPNVSGRIVPNGMLSGPGGGVSVNVINNSGQPARVEENARPGGGRDIRVVVGELVAQDIRGRGPSRAAIEQVFGFSGQLAGR